MMIKRLILKKMIFLDTLALQKIIDNSLRSRKIIDPAFKR